MLVVGCRTLTVMSVSGSGLNSKFALSKVGLQDKYGNTTRVETGEKVAEPPCAHCFAFVALLKIDVDVNTEFG